MTALSPARFLALGDSYTIGEGVEPAQRWPAQLAARLSGSGIALADPEIVATTGWTTDELAAAIRAHRFAPPYALVSLLIGVNNQYRGRTLDNYREEFVDLLAQAVAFAGSPKRAVVVSIPDWGVTRFAVEQGRDRDRIAQEIDAYNAAARDLSRRGGVAFVDVTDVSRDAGDAAAMLTTDGLHPSGAQYARWTDRIEPAVRALLAAAAEADPA